MASSPPNADPTPYADADADDDGCASGSAESAVPPSKRSIPKVLYDAIENCHQHMNDKLGWNENGAFIVKDRTFFEFHIVPLLANFDESFRFSPFEKQIVKYGYSTTNGIVFRPRKDVDVGFLVGAGLKRRPRHEGHEVAASKSSNVRTATIVSGTADEPSGAKRRRTVDANGESASVGRHSEHRIHNVSEALATVASSSPSSTSQPVSPLRSRAIPSVRPSHVSPATSLPFAAESSFGVVRTHIPQFIQDVVNYGIRNESGVVSWYLDGFRVDDVHIFKLLVLPFSKFRFRQKRQSGPTAIFAERFHAFERCVASHGFSREVCNNGSLVYRPTTTPAPLAKTPPRSENLPEAVVPFSHGTSANVPQQGQREATMTKRKGVLPPSIPTPLPLVGVPVARARLYKTLKDAVLTCPSSLNRYSPNSVFLCGKAGTGKSTYASNLVRDVELRRCFSDGISWINLRDSDKMIASAVELIGYYRIVLTDLKLTLSACEAPLFDTVPADIESKDRPMQQLERAKACMTRFMAHRSSLVVLDDVFHLEDVQWFNFQSNEEMECPCRVLVTSRTKPVSIHRVVQSPPLVVEVPEMMKEMASVKLPRGTKDTTRRRSAVDNDDMFSFMSTCAAPPASQPSAAANEDVTTLKAFRGNFSAIRGRYNEQMRQKTTY